MFKYLGYSTDPVPVYVGTEAVIEAGALQTIPMRDLDRIDLGHIERLGNLLDVIEALLVADGVHPVAQGDVLDVELLRGGLGKLVMRPSFQQF